MKRRLVFGIFAFVMLAGAKSVQSAGNEEEHKFYHDIPPLKGKVINGYSDYQVMKNPKGMIVIIEGSTKKEFPHDEVVKYLCKWTKIPELASKQNWATIIIPYGENLYMNDSLYDAFQVCINDALHKYGIKSGQYIIGGFSAGGAMAVGFSEAVIRDKKTNLIPNAVFAIDPVLDLIELYRASEREAKRDCKVDGANVGTSEATNPVS